MSSWYDACADRYAEWSTVTADVPFYVELARETKIGPDGHNVEAMTQRAA